LQAVNIHIVPVAEHAGRICQGKLKRCVLAVLCVSCTCAAEITAWSKTPKTVNSFQKDLTLSFADRTALPLATKDRVVGGTGALFLHEALRESALQGVCKTPWCLNMQRCVVVFSVGDLEHLQVRKMRGWCMLTRRPSASIM
jgi:hypothetical protein